jgi:site-specific recombinase XerD
LGHSDVSTTIDIYTGVSDEYVFEEYRKKFDPENV